MSEAYCNQLQHAFRRIPAGFLRGLICRCGARRLCWDHEDVPALWLLTAGEPATPCPDCREYGHCVHDRPALAALTAMDESECEA